MTENLKHPDCPETREAGHMQSFGPIAFLCVTILGCAAVILFKLTVGF